MELYIVCFTGTITVTYFSKGVINNPEALRLKSEFQKDIEKLRSWMEKERREREINLHKKFAVERKKKYAELVMKILFYNSKIF